MRSFFAILLAFALTACGSTVQLSFDDKDNPNRVTSVTGLESHDAANVITNRDYIDGKVKAPQKAIVSMKAHPGQQITINAAEFTVWQPSGPQDDIKAPAQAKSAFERNTAAIGGLVKDVTPAMAVGAALSDRKDARASAIRQSEIQADTAVELETLRSQERLSNKPIVLTIPEGGSAEVLEID